MWGLVGNPEDRFSHNEAQLVYLWVTAYFSSQVAGPDIAVWEFAGLIPMSGTFH